MTIWNRGKRASITLKNEIDFKEGTTINLFVDPDGHFVVTFQSKGVPREGWQCWFGGTVK